jgi:hypothetical protein
MTGRASSSINVIRRINSQLHRTRLDRRQVSLSMMAGIPRHPQYNTALRQVQRGFSIDDERADRRRSRAWSRAAAVGTADALRGWSVPLMAVISMMTTNRAAPGGARQRGAADVRPR